MEGAQSAEKAVGLGTDRGVGHLPCSSGNAGQLECKAMKASNSVVLRRVRMIQRLRDSSGLESGIELEDILSEPAWETVSERRGSSPVCSHGAECIIGVGFIGLVAILVWMNLL
jgi:hypothetical protein